VPIIDVEIIIASGESPEINLAAKLADGIGEVLGLPPGSTWVKLRAILSNNYAENGAEVAPDAYPVFVTILKRQLPPPEIIQDEVTKLTNAIAEICHRQLENVHVIYEPEGKGRIAFGGKIIQ
jgi:phenylpyruvate tautomerase PptA (4-oxalocrotonate tautomerase family)